MADAIESVEKLNEDVNKLSRSLIDLQSGFSSVGKAIPTDNIIKLSTTTVELQRQLSLGARELDRLKESITKVGQATRFYNDIELTSLVKQLQTSSTAFGRAAASSEKYLELLVNKFPVGAETAIRSLNQMSKTIPELSLTLQQGTKAQYDYATALSVFIQYGPEALATYNQFTSSLSGVSSQELENIRTTKDFQREVTQLSLALQKDFLPVVHNVSAFMKEMNSLFGDTPAKIVAVVSAMAAIGTVGMGLKKGLGSFGSLLGVGGAARAGGAAAAVAEGGGAAAATELGVLGTAGAGLKLGAAKLFWPVLIGTVLGGLSKSVIEQYAEERNSKIRAGSTPAERASVSRALMYEKAGGTSEYFAQQKLSGMGTEEQASSRNEAAARSATGINKLLLERDAILDRLGYKQKEMNMLEEDNLNKTEKYKEIATSRLLELNAFRDSTQRITEYYDIQNSQLESQAKMLENMNRPIGERATVYLQQIRNLSKEFNSQLAVLKQMEALGVKTNEIEKQKALVMNIQAEMTSKALMARRSWMEQMTALAIGLPEGTYTLPNEIPGVQALGAGYQAFRPMKPGDTFGGTFESMRGMLENEAWSGGSWRTPAEQDIGSVFKEGNEIAKQQLDISKKMLDAMGDGKTSAPENMNRVKGPRLSGLSGDAP